MKSAAPESSATVIDSVEHMNLNRSVSPQAQTTFSNIPRPTPQQQRAQDQARVYPGDHNLGKHLPTSFPPFFQPEFC